jgi:hypothetical protein
MNRYGSRKFIVSLLALALTAWMRSEGVLSDDATSAVMIAAVVGYMGGNVGASAVAPKKKEVA